MAEQGSFEFEEMTAIEKAFRLFIHERPEVYRLCLRFLREAKDAGLPKIGIGAVFERMRWEVMLTRSDREQFKLNNNYRSYMTRLVKQLNPGEFDDFINTRRLQRGAREPVFTETAEQERPTSPIEGHIAPARDMDGEDDPDNQEMRL